MGDASGTVAYITGASHGIGRLLATSLGDDGARVAAFARPSDELDSLSSDTGAIVPISMDVTEPWSVTSGFAEATQVETLAVAGLNTRDAIAIAADIGNDEWAVYCFGANDAAPWKRVPPEEFAANYLMLLRHGIGARQLVLGPAPVVESGRPGDRTNAELALYSAIAADVARSCGGVFVALLDVLGLRELAADGVHLNNQGYDILERIVVATIAQPLHDVADTSTT